MLGMQWIKISVISRIESLKKIYLYSYLSRLWQNKIKKITFIKLYLSGITLSK